MRLKEELDLLRDKVQKPKKKKGKMSSTAKRFRVLYKNLEFTDRAIEGFTDLPDTFQLKAEELISRLNENHSLITVKRKVFGKGGKMNILEVDFAYSGRLYHEGARRETPPLWAGCGLIANRCRPYLFKLWVRSLLNS